MIPVHYDYFAILKKWEAASFMTQSWMIAAVYAVATILLTAVAVLFLLMVE